MERSINPEMVILAREYRGLTQEELARQLSISQARVARIEGGLQTDVPQDVMTALSGLLGFPESFFTQDECRLGFGSSAYFYRKKSDITAIDRKRIHGLVNLLRITIKKFIEFVEIGATKPLPSFDLNDYGGSPAKAAKALRGMWKLPDGPVKDVTALIEAAGVIVVPCNFGTRAMDATSLRLNEMPPLIFINQDIPGDRWRFTLCHELAHLVLHDVPHESIEDEADAFAAEFLMPESDMRGQFSRHTRLRLLEFSNFKLYWKTSMGALIERAYTLGVLDSNQRRHLWMTMAKLGYKTKEPHPIEVEQTKTYRKLIEYFRATLDYGVADFQRLLHLNLPELKELVGVSSSGSNVDRPSLLRAVR